MRLPNPRCAGPWFRTSCEAGLVWCVVHRDGDRLIGHNGGDSGVATQMFFRPRDGTGVITLANGDWHRAGGRWPLSIIMDRLFAEAGRLP